jgi:hypothetical protein
MLYILLIKSAGKSGGQGENTSMKGKPNWQTFSRKRAIQLECLYRGTEEGVVKATDELDGKRYPFDPSVHAGLVRLHARDFFKKFPSIFQHVIDLNNAGMLLISGNDRFRLFKSVKDGKPPLPGDSKELLRYYNQQDLVWQPQLLGLLDVDPDEPFNYISHWRITSNGRFKGINLACPKQATPYQVAWHFDEPIDNPALKIAAAIKEAVGDDWDLPLKIRQLPLTGGDESTE